MTKLKPPQHIKHFQFSFIGTDTKNIIIIHDCIAYVDDPDNAESLGSGQSLFSASTHAVGTGNKNIILIYDNIAYADENEQIY